MCLEHLDTTTGRNVLVHDAHAENVARLQEEAAYWKQRCLHVEMELHLAKVRIDQLTEIVELVKRKRHDAGI
jgi:hypothetical protein